MDCGPRPHLPKICTQNNPPPQKALILTDFAYSASAVTASEKVQSSLIASRQCAFHEAIDEPCALLRSAPNGGSKLEYLHLSLPFIFSLQVIVDTPNVICWLSIASPSLRMTNTL